MKEETNSAMKGPAGLKPGGPTRRDFLKEATTLAVGLAPSQYSRRETRGHTQTNQDSNSAKQGSHQPSRAAYRRKSSLFIGTQYYRPPNPRREDWDQDLSRIKETGLDVARVWLYWAKVNPHPGVWTWEDYDALFDLAHKHGVKVLLQYMPEAAPCWFAEKHPQTLYIDKDGKPIELHAIPALAIGGLPGVSIDHAIAKTAVKEFIQRVAEHYRNHPALYGYDAWNEIWLPQDYSHATEVRFQGWLRNTYEGIAALNRKYGTHYEDFAEVHIPKTGVYGNMFDYWEFLHWLKQDRLAWLAQTIHSADPRHVVVSHAGYPFIWDSDAWGLATTVDKWGTSCYIGNEHRSLQPQDVHDIALVFNATRDSAQGKPWWVAETTGGTFFNGLGHGRTSEAEVRLKMVLGIAFGAEALLFWQWRPEIYGQESPNYGLTGLGGELTSRTAAVRDVARVIAGHRAVFDNLEWTQPQVGLLWSPRGALFEHEMPLEQQVGWKNFEGFYRGLIDGGFSVTILNDRVLAKSGIPEGIRIIFAPLLLFDRVGLWPQLEEWVKEGGTLVGGPRYALYDPLTYANKAVPPPETRSVFGVKMEETYYPLNATVHIPKNTLMPGLPSTVTGQLLMETYQVYDADILGTWEGRPVFTCKRFGGGRGIMIGSFIGNNYSWMQKPQLAKLAGAVCESAAVRPEVYTSGGCILRMARSGRYHVFFLVNPHRSLQHVSVTLPKESSGPVMDLFDDRTISPLESQGTFSLQLALEAKAAKILLSAAEGSRDLP